MACQSDVAYFKDYFLQRKQSFYPGTRKKIVNQRSAGRKKGSSVEPRNVNLEKAIFMQIFTFRDEKKQRPSP